MDYRGRELREVGAGSDRTTRTPSASAQSGFVIRHAARPRLRRSKTWSQRAKSVRLAARLRSSADPLAVAFRQRMRAYRRRLAILASVTAAVGAAVAADGGQWVRAQWAALPDQDGLARLAGFGLDQISLTGQRFTFDRDVFDALDLANARSIASFDADEVKARIERLSWVATAQLTRVFPNRMDVRITERRPFAVWTRGERDYLIDATGRVLGAVSKGARLDLPHVSGEGAADEASGLLGLLARYPEVGGRLLEAERVGERRWTLKLSGGVVLNLPPSREVFALELIAADAPLRRLVSGKNCVVDLRTPGRVTARSTAVGESGGCAGAST
jgi:cell division protein FtsQ